MFNFRKREEEENIKKNNIQPIICVGILAFIVILITCLVHIRSLRDSLKEVISEQYEAQLQVSEEAVCDRMMDIEAITQHAAKEVEEKLKKKHSNIQIAQVLAKYATSDDVSMFTYISAEGVSLYANGETCDVRDRMLDISVIDGNCQFVVNNFFKDRHDYLVLHVSPVIVDNETIGIVTAIQDCKKIIAGESFSNINEIGNVFIMDRDAHILASTYEDEKVLEKTDSFLDFATGIFHMDDESTEEIRTAIQNAKTDSRTMVLKDKNNQDCYYALVAVSGYEDVVVCVTYRDNVLQVDGSGVVGSTVSTAVIIIVAMMFLLMVVLLHTSRTGKMIAKFAFEDAVTGGKNLNYFKREATEILKKYKGMAFSIHRFDISNFRYINEAYGHDKADRLLRVIDEEAAQIFSSNELCVRMNADQHVLLTKNTLDLEERLFMFTDKVNARALDIGIRYPIKLKRGVYKVQNTAEDISIMIDKANAARKELTGEEKECVAIYSDKMVRDMRKVNMIESSMERALFNGEFKMFIQPKWDIIENHLYGGEALVRWVRDDGSMVYPSEFVPVFEKNGFVEQLDMYMLECACQMIRCLVDAGKPVYPISVNQSRVLIHNPQYLDKVKEVMQRYDIPKGSIELEVTETVLFMEQGKMLSIMNSLKSQDIPLSMDDFGSGYSSLNLLKDFPFDVLKIDKEFFSESITSEASIWILTKIVEMAHGLGIKVICEGVETKEQVEMLKKIGVRYVQGFYFSRPIPSKRFLEQFCGLEDFADVVAASQSNEEEARENLLEAEKERAGEIDSVAEPEEGNT